MRIDKPLRTREINPIIKSVILIITLILAAQSGFATEIDDMQNSRDTMEYDLDFYTEYSQFYVCDGDDQLKSGLWTDKSSHSARLDFSPGIIAVLTECYGPVQGQMRILNSENNEFDLDSFDHIVEAGLMISSGSLEIRSCPTNEIELKIEMPNGQYRCRVYSSNLDSVVGDEGDDFYFIEIWPSTETGRKVIKQKK